MTRLNFGYRTGRTLHGKARTGAGVYIQSDVTMTETPAGNGVYGGDTSSPLTEGDVVAIYDILNSNLQPVGFGEYDYTNSDVLAQADSHLTIIKSDIAVQDISGISDSLADAIAQADSHLTIIKSDIALNYSSTKEVKSDVQTQKSNMDSALSDLELIYDVVRTRYYEYHLDE